MFHDSLDHFLDRQLACVVRQHDVEHSFHAAFRHIDFFRTLNDVSTPEGEENRHWLAVSRCSVGDDEGSQRFVQIPTEDNHCRAIFSFLQDRCLCRFVEAG